LPFDLPELLTTSLEAIDDSSDMPSILVKLRPIHEIFSHDDEFKSGKHGEIAAQVSASMILNSSLTIKDQAQVSFEELMKSLHHNKSRCLRDVTNVADSATRPSDRSSPPLHFKHVCAQYWDTYFRDDKTMQNQNMVIVHGATNRSECKSVVDSRPGLLFIELGGDFEESVTSCLTKTLQNSFSTTTGSRAGLEMLISFDVLTGIVLGLKFFCFVPALGELYCNPNRFEFLAVLNNNIRTIRPLLGNPSQREVPTLLETAVLYNHRSLSLIAVSERCVVQLTFIPSNSLLLSLFT